MTVMGRFVGAVEAALNWSGVVSIESVFGSDSYANARRVILESPKNPFSFHDWASASTRATPAVPETTNVTDEGAGFEFAFPSEALVAVEDRSSLAGRLGAMLLCVYGGEERQVNVVLVFVGVEVTAMATGLVLSIYEVREFSQRHGTRHETRRHQSRSIHVFALPSSTAGRSEAELNSLHRTLFFTLRVRGCGSNIGGICACVHARTHRSTSLVFVSGALSSQPRRAMT